MSEVTPREQCPPVLVEVRRGNIIESRHRGFISAVEPSGRALASLGDTSNRVFLRSVAKPFQTIPVIASGACDRFGFTTAELAVMTSSHSGEAMHTDLVRSILTKTGLDESSLQCGDHYPFDEPAAHDLRRHGCSPTALHNNCSGKHAGMLALAIHLDAPIDDYLNPAHPVQVMIRETLAAFARVAPDDIDIAIDGCSAPVFVLSLSQIARAYAVLASNTIENLTQRLRVAATRVADAMTSFPELIGGTRGRLDTELMAITSGEVISKVGAEGVHLVAVRPGVRYSTGCGIALKIESGDTGRARDLAVVETLRQLGVLTSDQVAAIVETRQIIRNHRSLVVGGATASFILQTQLQ
jgi:L-asparaginase II